MSYTAVVITCSDRAAADIYEDRSGPVLRDGLAELGFTVLPAVLVPDDTPLIQQAVRDAVGAGARVILTTGGTGVGPRDVTVEATAELLAYDVPGIAEAVRRAGAAKTELATLSRGLAGVIAPADGRPCFIFNAPGSRGGARDTLAVLSPLLTHIVEQLDGADHDLNRPPSQPKATQFTHLDGAGQARMVDVTEKQTTVRTATAEASVKCSPEVVALLRDHRMPKGDVLAVARSAGIAAAKRVPDLLPLAHVIGVHGVVVDLAVTDSGVDISATVRAADRTGVEMEALTAATVAALAVVDMAKGVDRLCEITSAKVVAKSGGRSGDWRRPAE